MPKAKTEIPVKVTKSAPAKKVSEFGVPMVNLEGAKSGNLELPKEIFGAKVNKVLLAQALRVYLNNQTGHFAHTKTRAEVTGSTRKIYRQKGTGGARHGSKRAPIFVHGGIALGPKSRKVVLDLPKRMKKAALISALSQKLAEKEIIGIKGAEKASGKTAQVSALLKKLGRKNALIVTDDSSQVMVRAARNIPGIEITSASQVNILSIIGHKSLILSATAIEGLQKRVAGEGKV